MITGKQVKVTRDTQVGFGYIALQDIFSEARPTEPAFTGTIIDVITARSASREYVEVYASSIFVVADWFVMVDGRWMPIKVESSNQLYRLYQGRFSSVTVILKDRA